MYAMNIGTAITEEKLNQMKNNLKIGTIIEVKDFMGVVTNKYPYIFQVDGIRECHEVTHCYQYADIYKLNSKEMSYDI